MRQFEPIDTKISGISTIYQVYDAAGQLTEVVNGPDEPPLLVRQARVREAFA